MKRTSRRELQDLLGELGIGPGDRVMVHSFVPSLGIVEGGLPGLVEALVDKIGPEGTLIVPTFTYSFRRSQVFDIRNSPSTVGAFSEYVRTLPDAIRSRCPLFSMAVLGPDATDLMSRESNRCFGLGSIYQKLFDAGIKFVGLGVEYDYGYAFFMHLERLAEVPFRRDQRFQGRSIDAGGTEFDDEAIHFVRVEDPPWRRNRRRLCEEFVEEGVIREVTFNGIPHRMFDSNVFAPLVLDRLRHNPWCMADRL